MCAVGDKIIYGEHGVCTIIAIAPMDPSDPSSGVLYYHLSPLFGSGTYFSPVDSPAFMRPVMSREEAEHFIDRIPSIAPAICEDNRFNHVDAFYREIFKQHETDGLVSIIKGLTIRTSGKKNRSSRADLALKRAKQILYGELSIALGIEYEQVEAYVKERTGEA